jgi:hypothetical protein
MYTLFCFGGDFTSRERTQDCSSALAPLQVSPHRSSLHCTDL